MNKVTLTFGSTSVSGEWEDNVQGHRVEKMLKEALDKMQTSSEDSASYLVTQEELDSVLQALCAVYDQAVFAFSSSAYYNAADVTIARTYLDAAKQILDKYNCHTSYNHTGELK